MSQSEKIVNFILPPHGLPTRKGASGVVEVWVASRRKWLQLTPEEEVRRRMVAHLVGRLGVPVTHVAEEYPVELNGQSQRADIVVFDPQLRPWMVVECKAPEVALCGDVLDQVVRYNSVIGAPVVVVTNGLGLKAYGRGKGARYGEIDFPL